MFWEGFQHKSVYGSATLIVHRMQERRCVVCKYLDQIKTSRFSPSNQNEDKMHPNHPNGGKLALFWSIWNFKVFAPEEFSNTSSKLLYPLLTLEFEFFCIPLHWTGYFLPNAKSFSDQVQNLKNLICPAHVLIINLWVTVKSVNYPDNNCSTTD